MSVEQTLEPGLLAVLSHDPGDVWIGLSFEASEGGETVVGERGDGDTPSVAERLAQGPHRRLTPRHQRRSGEAVTASTSASARWSKAGLRSSRGSHTAATAARRTSGSGSVAHPSAMVNPCRGRHRRPSGEPWPRLRALATGCQRRTGAAPRRDGRRGVHREAVQVRQAHTRWRTRRRSPAVHRPGPGRPVHHGTPSSSSEGRTDGCKNDRTVDTPGEAPNEPVRADRLGRRCRIW